MKQKTNQIIFYMPNENEIEDNYTMAITDLYKCKECLTCKKYYGKNDLDCEHIQLKLGEKRCYIWRGLIEE